MTEKEILKQLNIDISDETPDILDTLIKETGFAKSSIDKLSDVPKDDKSMVYDASERHKNMPEPEISHRKKMPVKKAYRIIAACAAALLIFVGGSSFLNSNNKAFAVIGFDVNPGIEITVDEKEKVTGAKAVNTEGKKILQELDLKGSDAKVACYAIVGSMMAKGYLTSTSNSVFVSVSAADAKKGKELEESISKEVNEFTENYQVAISVFGQYIEGDDDLQKFAAKENISIGKAWLIQQLSRSGSARMTEQELMKLPVQELLILAQEKKVGTGSSYGEPDRSKYIGTKKATAIALKNAGITKSQARNIYAEYECEDGRIIYEIEFIYGNTEYEYDIDASTGKILSYDIEKIKPGKSGGKKVTESYDDDDDEYDHDDDDYDDGDRDGDDDYDIDDDDD